MHLHSPRSARLAAYLLTNTPHSDNDQPDDQRIERYSFGQSTPMAGQD
jgi:hypothetical protein